MQLPYKQPDRMEAAYPPVPFPWISIRKPPSHPHPPQEGGQVQPKVTVRLMGGLFGQSLGWYGLVPHEQRVIVLTICNRLYSTPSMTKYPTAENSPHNPPSTTSKPQVQWVLPIMVTLVVVVRRVSHATHRDAKPAHFCIPTSSQRTEQLLHGSTQQPK